ncbi:hypothetical protein A2160_06135 [Candidatus Beckwithbacteria bacterium RBG_13_42_9]|uniref:Uncharacterized protein n=1 Tax=Candidatus Beckwithbacteria bacterium RBG_13_42_9 TaxID=1797457 RepID=A0A1F5E5D3_9BACT|nr:MAG: hypothetical protein A2160_06135 [Candidatus Beckwithbacteria bacterium RBG_13_42_9]
MLGRMEPDILFALEKAGVEAVVCYFGHNLETTRNVLDVLGYPPLSDGELRHINAELILGTGSLILIS